MAATNNNAALTITEPGSAVNDFPPRPRLLRQHAIIYPASAHGNGPDIAMRFDQIPQYVVAHRVHEQVMPNNTQ
jgi:hypothetical protein